MKLMRYGAAGKERPGIIDAAGQLRDLSQYVDDLSGEHLSDAAMGALRALDPAALPLVEGDPRYGPCVAKMGKLLGIGLNYSDHAAETKSRIPQHPIVFLKATSSIIGPNDTVVLPRNASKADWEVELGVVIGKPCKYVSEADALDYVAGYCIVNDVSERHFQTQISGQWTKGKSCDTFGPLGPWLVTRDEVGDPQNLRLSLSVNGVAMQSGNTANMIFTVRQIIAHLSQLMTLHPGDTISSGTPAGVAMGMAEPRYLRPEDVMEVSIEGLGRQRQAVTADT